MPQVFDKGLAGARTVTTCTLVLLAFGAPQVPLTAQAPDEDWQTFDTEHFSITYPAELEATARRAADRAERAYDALEAGFIAAPSGRIDIVVTDHTDDANGFATVIPSNRITVFATPPVQSLSLQYFDDWLELLITHELAHIFHLDRSHPLGRAVRKVFGRVPLAWPVFPESLVPTWTIEGLATHYESKLTDSGRSKGTYHDMVLRTAALEDDFEGIGQASGQSPVWPAGPRPYIYGSKFFDYLSDTHGDEAVSGFVEAIQGQWIPFRLNSAAKNAFGTKLSDEWDEWAAAETLEANAAATRTAGPTGVPVIDHGRFALFPRTSPDGSHLLVARSDGRSNSQLRSYTLNDDGSPIDDGDKLTRTNGFSIFAWLPDGSVVFTQSDLVDPYRSYSDLYRASPSGVVEQITSRARVSQPDATPDGGTVIAVQGGSSSAALVEIDLASGEVTPLTEPSPDALWANPRVSPDGRWIAASRWTPGGFLDVFVLDRTGRIVSRMTEDRASDTSPTWSSDGRHLVWSSDRNGTLNLFGAEIGADAQSGPVRQITRVPTGVTYPWVDGNRASIYASVYHADGWDIERLAFDPGSWFDPDPLDSRFLDGGDAAAQGFDNSVDAPARSYSAGRSLLPRYWLPAIGAGQDVIGRKVIGLTYGFQTSGSDLVGRHAYGLGLAYEPKGERFSGGFSYAFRGFGTPIVGLGVSQAYDADPRVGVRADATRVQLFEVERFQGAALSAAFPRVRRRSFSQLTVSGGGLWTSSELLDNSLVPSQEFQLSAPKHSFVQGAVSLFASNVQGHAFSVSGEDGISVSLTGRVRNEMSLGAGESGVPGFDDSVDDAIGVVQMFKAFDAPGFSRHVFALRFAGGAARGPGADRFYFDLGGAGGQGQSTALGGAIGGTPLLFGLRGYPEDIRAGRFAWTATGEYRFPIAVLHQGLGVFPLYFDRLWGALFFDAGNAWGELEGFETPNPSRDPLLAAGGELAVRLVPFWAGSLDVRVGVGVPLKDATYPFSGELIGDSPRFYVRLGRSF